MRKSGLLIGAILMAACSACGGNPKVAHDGVDAARSGVRFRYDAREMYRDLLRESCEANPALRRAVVLKREIDAVHAFEHRTLSESSASHPRVARNDVAYLQTSGKLGCWADSDPRFAKMHVQMARAGVLAGLAALNVAGRDLIPLPDAEELVQTGGAKFRSIIVALVQDLEPLCRIARTADDDQILAPARAELAGFRQRLRGTSYALQFAVAETDARYGRGVPECAEPDTAAAKDLANQALQTSRAQIAKAEVLAGI